MTQVAFPLILLSLSSLLSASSINGMEVLEKASLRRVDVSYTTVICLPDDRHEIKWFISLLLSQMQLFHWSRSCRFCLSLPTARILAQQRFSWATAFKSTAKEGRDMTWPWHGDNMSVEIRTISYEIS